MNDFELFISGLVMGIVITGLAVEVINYKNNV